MTSGEARLAPQWGGQPVAEGWWLLSFRGDPGPRYWDGSAWRDTRECQLPTSAEEFADYPIIKPLTQEDAERIRPWICR